MKTKAAVRLAEICRTKITQAALARELDIPRQAIVAWLKGAYKPSLARMMAIEKKFKVPLRDWTVAP